MEATADPRVVLVHDWLTGMRGGEKCLEVLCRRYPDAPLYTLLHRAGSVAPEIEARGPCTSFLQHFPGVARYYRYLLPLMPAAVAGWRLPRCDLVVSCSHCVAKSVRVPAGVPHICYCFTPMRYAWHLRREYFGSPDGQPWGRRVLSQGRDCILDRIKDWDRRTSDRVTHFVAISQTVARRIEECYGRESEII